MFSLGCLDRPRVMMKGSEPSEKEFWALDNLTEGSLSPFFTSIVATRSPLASS